jgi:para-nitrobenzyl esterase
LLAKHCAEVPYLFGSLLPPQAYDDVDAEVSDELQHGWVEFARAGTLRSLDGSPWPGYDNGDPRLTVIADTTEAGRCSPARSPR